MKNNYYSGTILLLLFLFPTFLYGTERNITPYRIMFYNVENLFDTVDDPDKIDEEFLPNGDRYWNDRKLNLKLNRIFQVVMALGKGNHPAIIGLCEVENLNVLELLLARTPLGKMGYKIVHKESPDRRGIDVALLYLPDRFNPIDYKAIPLINPNDDNFKTRDILHVKGIMATDTLHFFVNHWPSKYGGVVETKPLRALAAQTLRSAIDSLFLVNDQSKIVVMGDMNDSPFDESITQYLKAQTQFNNQATNDIYNLAYPLAKQGIGSNKYQGKWEMIDQIIVSGALLGTQGLVTTENGFTVFDAEFLLEKDKTHLGKKPFRSYIGFKYNNGFSDHLPVYIDLILSPN